MNNENQCFDCDLTPDGQHSPNCLTQWQSGEVTGGKTTGACLLCGALTTGDARVCSSCADDFGRMQRMIDAWRKSKVTEVTLRAQVAAIAEILCDQRGMSEQQAADFIGVSRLTIRHWRGKDR